MPQVITHTLRTTGSPSGMLGHVHGLACRLLEPPDADHNANDRPFAVWPLLRSAPKRHEELLLRVGWLDDERSPHGDASALHLGGSPVRLVKAVAETVPYAALTVTGPLRAASFEWHSPTYFSRNDRDLPLPDPVVTVRSWARRWNLFQVPGSPAAIEAAVIAELLSTIMIRDPDLRPGRLKYGHNKQSGKDLIQRGFTGTARFVLAPRCGYAAAAVFGALARFAEYAGTGAQTTYGFGATTCTPDG